MGSAVSGTPGAVVDSHASARERSPERTSATRIAGDDAELETDERGAMLTSVTSISGPYRGNGMMGGGGQFDAHDVPW